MTIQLHQPFTRKTFEHFVSKWAEVCNHNECVSILNLAKRDQLYRIKQIQDNMEIVKKHLTHFPDFQILYLDITSERIEDTVDIETYFKKHTSHYRRTVLFILDADKLLNERKNILFYLDNLYHQIPHLSIIYLFQQNIMLPCYTKGFSSYSTLYQNIQPFPLFNREDTEEFMIQMNQRFQVTFPHNVKNKILELCGGNLWLIKQACREYAHAKKVDTIFDNDGMNLRLEVLYNEFSPEERIVLEKIIRKQEITTPDEKQIQQYFLTIRLIQKNSSGFSLTIPILKHYIMGIIFKHNQIKINEREQIIIDNILIDSLFSRRERKVIKYFLKSNNQTISRETLASQIWENTYKKDYTDWALDQFIKRLRNKITQLGLDSQIIKTVKNQGFIFQNPYAYTS